MTNSMYPYLMYEYATFTFSVVFSSNGSARSFQMQRMGAYDPWS